MRLAQVFVIFFYFTLENWHGVQGQGIEFVPHNPNLQEGNLNGAIFCESLSVDSTVPIYKLKVTNAVGPVTFTCTSAEFLFYVNIDPSTGDVFLKNQFDREATQNMLLDLQVTDGKYQDTVQSYITIYDANDNAPQFNLPSYLVSVYEDILDNRAQQNEHATVVGEVAYSYEVILDIVNQTTSLVVDKADRFVVPSPQPWTDLNLEVSATDPDGSFAGTITLSIKDPNSVLTLDNVSSSPSIATSNVQVKSGEMLDYENSPVLSETLVAQDDGDTDCDPQLPLKTEASVTINIKDGPDRPPFFPAAPYFKELPEGTNLGSTILTVEAKDGDYGLSWEMSYSLVQGSGVEEVFAVDPTSGNITITGSVDREDPASLANGGVYRFSVMATEVIPPGDPFTSMGNTNNLPMTATASVSITVTDNNDNTPTFYELNDVTDTSDKTEKNVFTTEMDEETSNFITVPGLSIFVQDLDEGTNAQFKLSLSPNDAFDISPTIVNGEAIVTLRVKDSTKIDYEKIKFVVVTISAQEYAGSKSITSATVNITLNDVNDHSPEFDNVQLKANVSEDAAKEVIIETFKATDEDSGIYSEITYDLSDSSGLFGIDANTGVVTLKGKLDREITSTYYVTIRATDGGGRFSTASLEITVQDVNDESPIFQRSSYSALLPENSDTFASEVLIYASDADKAGSPNSEVTYSIIGGDDFGNFRVEQPSGGQIEGKIVIENTVDMEQLDQSHIDCNSGGVGFIDLLVMAQDQGEPPLNSTVNVRITVEDVNDFPPAFTSADYHANVSEKSPYATEFFRIVANDSDACGPNNYLDYQISLTEGTLTSSNVFLIDTESDGDVYTGVLKIKDPKLDRNDESLYEVVIVATDRGENRMSSSTTVMVTVDDVNDKPPELDDTSWNDVEVPEDAVIGDDVQTIVANDSDNNPKLEYGINSVECYDELGSLRSQNCSDRFEIVSNNQNGYLKVAKELDREHIATFVIRVNVTDLNAVPDSVQGFQTDYGYLTVIVTDVNDNLPLFEKSLDLNVNEAEDNAVVGTVHAVDADKGMNAEVEYYVDPLSSEFISINSETGEIRTSTTNIDREKIGDLLNVTIGARDKGNPSLYSNSEFAIVVNDVNDNDPVFLTLSSAVLQVEENSILGTFVYQVNATDADLGPNAKLRYSLEEGQDSFFTIGQDDGKILTNGQLDREDTDHYQITVVAEDSGGSPRLTTVDLTVHILDVDDNEPKYLQKDKEQDLTVPEGSQDAMVGYVAEASDADLPENGNNYYFIVGGTGTNYFSINITTRELTTSQALDREEKSEYDLVIKATSNELFVPPATPVNWNDVSDDSSMLHVKVNVSDINDNAPVFTETLYQTDIPYNTQPDATSTVIQVQATDADVGNNAIVEYSISGTVWVLNNKPTEVQNVFGIVASRDGNSGDIILVGVIINDVAGYYEITVQATDANVNHVGQALVRVGIVQSDETVILFSAMSQEEFNSVRQQFITDLEAIVNAQVFVDKVLPHDTTGEGDQDKSDIYIHAKSWNSTDLVPKEEIVNKLDEPESTSFLLKYNINGYGNDEVKTDKTKDYLTAGLIIAGAVIVVVIIIFSIVIFVMHRNFKRNMTVAKAAQDAARDVLEMKTNGANSAVPNTNNFAGGSNPIYDEVGDNKFNLEYLTHESNDNDSIDDNEVDNQDSIMRMENEGKPIRKDDDQDLDVGAFQIDYQSDNANLAAALNRAHKDGDDLTFLFDEVQDGSTSM